MLQRREVENGWYWGVHTSFFAEPKLHWGNRKKTSETCKVARLFHLELDSARLFALIYVFFWWGWGEAVFVQATFAFSLFHICVVVWVGVLFLVSTLCCSFPFFQFQLK